MNAARIKVLIVDDSAIVRKLLSEALAEHDDIEVVGTAPDPYVARDKILGLKPDVLTLDIEMPRMDGLTFLRKLMRYHPMPVIVVSSVADGECENALTAMRLGAVDVLAKPGGPYSVGDLRLELAERIRAAALAQVSPSGRRTAPRRRAVSTASARDALIAIGASTGGTEAILEVLGRMPADCPPTVIVQHIPPVFSEALAQRLDAEVRPRVYEARDGQTVGVGEVLLAPGDRHMKLRRAGTEFRVVLDDGPRVRYHKPSVDVLFYSVADAAGRNAAAAILTGMGADGVRGLLAIREAGGRTFAQDRATSVVFGMPREALEYGAAERAVPLQDIASALLTCDRYVGTPV